MASMADDYENLQIIVNEVTTKAGSRQKALSRHEIIKAIQGLISDGYAQPYVLSPHPPHATPAAFDPERVDDLYYYLTPAGKKILTEHTKRIVSG